MLNRLSVNALLKSIIVTLSAVVVVILSLGALGSWHRMVIASRIAAAAEASTHLFTALHNMRVDRSSSNRLSETISKIKAAATEVANAPARNLHQHHRTCRSAPRPRPPALKRPPLPWRRRMRSNPVRYRPGRTKSPDAAVRWWRTPSKRCRASRNRRARSPTSSASYSIKQVSDIVSDIATASTEQATGLDQINKALNQMDEGTQQNSALVEENAATAKTLELQSRAMDQFVGFFQLDDAGRITMPVRQTPSSATYPAQPSFRACEPRARYPARAQELWIPSRRWRALSRELLPRVTNSATSSRPTRMIPKSGQRFLGKIMRQ